MKNERMTLIGHLEELRKVIIKSMIAILACSFLFYRYADWIILELAKPVGKLVFIAPSEAFATNIKIVLFLGLLFASPFVIYQIWQFISVGIKPEEKKYVFTFGPLSFIFFISGILFGYAVVVPIAMRFFLSFSSSRVLPMITISKYISFILTIALSFGLVFELPIVTLFFTKIGLINPDFLSKRRREAIVLVFIVAAVLTPPDVISQLLMALPLLILYEISIIFSKIAYNKPELKG